MFWSVLDQETKLVCGGFVGAYNLTDQKGFEGADF